jgi:hypothetical protein
MITHTKVLPAENEFVYILSFKPRRSKKYEGKLYVSENDYAVLRAYTLEEGEN